MERAVHCRTVDEIRAIGAGVTRLYFGDEIRAIGAGVTRLYFGDEIRAIGAGVTRLYFGDEIRAIGAGFTRLYFGDEFCWRLMPTPDELREALAAAREQALAFTLVTSFVPEEGLAPARALLRIMAGADGEGLEVVVNDVGVLRMASRECPALPLAAGRLLSRQRTDPRLGEMAQVLPHDVEVLRGIPLEAPAAAAFLQQSKARRIEVDNPPGGLLPPPGTLFARSLHYPFVYLAAARRCAAPLFRGARKFGGIAPCRRECRSGGATLAARELPGALHMRGNAVFAYNDALPGDLESLGVDRVVYELP